MGQRLVETRHSPVRLPPPQMKSHRMHLIPPATSYDNTYQISTREAEV